MKVKFLVAGLIVFSGIILPNQVKSFDKESNIRFFEKIRDKIYYSGKVNNRSVFIEFDKIAQTGQFFFVDDKPTTVLEQFNYRFIGKKLIVDYEKKIHTVQISGDLRGESLIGAVSSKRKLFGILPWFKKVYIFTLKPFVYPAGALNINRYKQQVFSEINIERDVIYGKAEGYRTSVDCENPPKFLDNLPSLTTKKLNLKMDIYSPVGDSLSIRPLVLLIHGGGFYIGNKECKTNIDLSEMLAGEGFVVAAIDYRIGFQPTKPAIKRSGYRAIQDGRAALRYLSFFKDKYRIDPMNVILMGTSAGAITSLNIAFLDEDERPDESKGSFLVEDEGCLDCTGNEYKSKFGIRSVINMWGAVHDLGIINPENKIPVLSIHGDQDLTVPYENDYPFREYSGYKLLTDKMFGSKLIDELRKKQNMKSELITFREFPHEPHMTNGNFNENYNVIKDGIKKFLYESFSDQLNADILKINIRGDESNSNFQSGAVPENNFLYWNVSGGFPVDQDNHHARIVWFENIPEHKMEIILSDPFRFLSNPVEVQLSARE